MGSIGEAIRYIYEVFLLRDVVSLVTPGALILLAAAYAFCPNVLSHSVAWPFYVPIFGAFFLVGFAAQCMGEILGVVTTQDTAESTIGKRLRVFSWKWAKRYNENHDQIIWWSERHARMAESLEAFHGDDRAWARQQRERLVVLKTMCGNAFVAVALSGILIAASYAPWSPVRYVLAVVLVLLPLLAALLWGHRIHALRQVTLTDSMLGILRGKDTQQGR